MDTLIFFISLNVIGLLILLYLLLSKKQKRAV